MAQETRGRLAEAEAPAKERGPLPLDARVRAFALERMEALLHEASLMEYEEGEVPEDFEKRILRMVEVVQRTRLTASGLTLALETVDGLVSLFIERLSDAALNEVRPVVELYFKRLRLANQTY